MLRDVDNFGEVKYSCTFKIDNRQNLHLFIKLFSEQIRGTQDDKMQQRK